MKWSHGQVNLAAKAPFKEAYARWIEKLTAKAQRAGVTFRLNTRVTPEMIAGGNPEVVILATGAEEAVPPLAGIDLPYVYFARQVLKGEVQCRGKVLVVGGGLVGMEVADYCREQGCTDLILTGSAEFCNQSGSWLLPPLPAAGITMVLGQSEEITRRCRHITPGVYEQW